MAPKAFVAYSSRMAALASMVVEGTQRASAARKDVFFQPWEFNDIAGTPLISPIIEGIDESPFVVADVTFLNPNVVYEIGYAIGRKRRMFLVRHRSTVGDAQVAREAGIFDTLGYEEYENAEELAQRLLGYINPTPFLFSGTLDRQAPVYVVEPPTKGEVATLMTSRLKKARYKFRSFNPAEDVRLSAADAIRQVACSGGVLASLLDSGDAVAHVHNTRALFVVGLADGMEKPSLTLVPKDYVAPLDVRDAVKHYTHPEDIQNHIGAFSPEITDYLQQGEPPPLGPDTALQSLQIGDPTAENEMSTLWTYYLQTDEFHRALRGEVNLVVGRKGAGKTALFIQVRDHIRADKRNIVVDLRPEGYQLLKLKEDILHHLAAGAREHLVTAFWEYLLLLEVAHKLLDKDRNTYQHNHEIHDLYVSLESMYRTGQFEAEGDFSERLHVLSNRLAVEYRAKYPAVDGERNLDLQEVSELLYAHDLRALRSKIQEYLDRKSSVWILFDNLDKNWNVDGVDAVDTLVLRCLIDAGRKLERDMRKPSSMFRCIVFIRNDVYQQLMKRSSDYGKEMKALLDWTEPDLLREMLRLRLVSGLDKSARQKTFDQIWPALCVSHLAGGEDTSNYMIDRSLMRPRNLLKIFGHCRGFAVNLNHPKITEEDVQRGVKAYSQDIMTEVDRELVDVFPRARDFLYQFIDVPGDPSLAELKELVLRHGLEEVDVEKVIDFLLYYGVIGLREEAQDRYIYDVNYDMKMIQARVKRAGENARFVINQAFWPALGIRARTA